MSCEARETWLSVPTKAKGSLTDRVAKSKLRLKKTWPKNRNSGTIWGRRSRRTASVKTTTFGQASPERMRC
ncbi:hypothetical protein D3C87_1996810 [compost metagenome]